MKKKNLLFLFAALLSATSLFAQKRVAFVYQSGYNVSRYVWDAEGYKPTLDPVYNGIAATYEVTDFVYASADAPDLETLKTFDLVVLSEAISGGSAVGNALKGLVGQVPVLSLKAYHYTNGRWSWAAPTNPAAKTPSVTINPGFESHPIFDGVTGAGGLVEIFDGTNTDNNQVQGFTTLIDGGLIEADKIMANITGTTTSAIHEITTLDHKYMLIPISSDVCTTVSPNGVKLVLNACAYLMGGAGGFDPDAPFKIAYLYDSSYSTYVGIAEDPIYNYSILAEKETEAIDIKDFTAASTDTLAALEGYDLIVISEAMGSGHAFAIPLLSLVNRTPVLNFKSFFYKNTVWNWGGGANPSSVKTVDGVNVINVASTAVNHPLFENIEVIDGQIELFNNAAGVNKNMVQGYTASASGPIANDSVLATVTGPVGTFNAIHEHGSSNIYMLIPMSVDALMWNEDINVSDNAFQMISNAVYYLLESKGTVYPAAVPSISFTYGNSVTYVSMTSATEGATIYYTIDGTEPTTSSNVYSGTIELTASATVKAISAMAGYNNSTVASMDVLVMSKAATPVISITSVDGGKQISLSAAAEARIFYSISGGDPDTLTATLYTEPFVVTRPALIKAVAAETGKLVSDVAADSATIDGYINRQKTLVWANFNEEPTTWTWANTDSTTTDNGDVIAKYAYTVPTEEDPNLTPTYKEVDFQNGFKVGTFGQRINLQKTGVAVTGNYSPATSGDAGASDRAMSFLTTNAGSDPTTAFMVTTTAYDGPFDATVWFTGAKSSSYTELLEVSVATSLDATEWTVLDTLSSIGDKKIRKRVAYYDEKAPVFVKFASASNLGTNSNMMIFDVKLMGEGVDPVSVEKPSVEKSLVSTRIFTVSGMEVKAPVYGINIVRNVYSDGSVETKKVFVNDRF